MPTTGAGTVWTAHTRNATGIDINGNIATINGMKYTVQQAAEVLNLSASIVRRYCQEKKCPAVYHEIPGTKRGYYSLSERSVSWLRKNIKPRRKKVEQTC